MGLNWFHRIAFLFLLILGASVTSKAQSFEVSVKPGQMLFFRHTELLISRDNERGELGLIIGFQPSTKQFGEVNFEGNGTFNGYVTPHQNKAFNMYTLGLFSAKKLRPKVLIASEILYRRWFYNKKNLEGDNFYGNGFNGLRSEKLHVVLLKGYFTFKEYFNKRFFISGNVGLGLRYRFGEAITHTGTVNEMPVSNHVQKHQNFIVSPQMGFRLGFLISAKPNLETDPQ